MRRNLKLAAALVVACAVALTAYGIGSASGASSARFGAWGKGAPAAASPDPDAPASASPTPTPDSFTVIGHPTADQFIDEAPTSSYTPGDRDIFTEDLRDQGTLVGRDHVTCTKQIGDFLDCAGTAEFRNRGKIEFSGTSHVGNVLVLAITGGTAEFADASGEIFVDISNSDSTILINWQ